MAVTEVEVYKRLSPFLGSAETEVLVEFISQTGEKQVAERLDGLATKQDLKDLRADYKFEMQEMRAEFKFEMQEMRSSMHIDLQKGFNTQLKWMLTFMSGIFLTIAGGLLAVLLK